MKTTLAQDDVLRRHLQYVIRDHIASSSDHYAQVALDHIKRQDPEIDDVTIRVDIRFEGVCKRFRKFIAGEVDTL